MRRVMKFVFVLSLFGCFLLTPVLMNGSSSRAIPASTISTHRSLNSLKSTSAAVLYDSLKLEEFGLNERAFKYAWKGFLKLAEAGKVINTDYLTICDFSQSSRNKRMYIIDLMSMKLFMNTYVAHGRNSGREFATSFSNRPESHKSSLGFYVTRNVYYGQHGMSLRIDGLEKGINDKAMARKIVIHGADYIGDNFLDENPFTGRSYGCPAVPAGKRDDVINTIKEGTCLFIYHPSKLYLSHSKILNG
jgi:hypothetical protein